MTIQHQYSASVIKDWLNGLPTGTTIQGPDAFGDQLWVKGSTGKWSRGRSSWVASGILVAFTLRWNVVELGA